MVTASSNFGALLDIIAAGSGSISSGAGSPEGAVIGSVGDLYRRTNGGPGNSLYLKISGNSTNTGWAPAGPALTEDLSAQVNGVLSTFTMTGNAYQNSGAGILVEVYLNGSLQRQGALNDYTITESGGGGTGFDTISFTFVPTIGDVLLVRYLPL